MFGGLSAVKQIRLVQAQRERGLTVRADRERVLQVLCNLLGNALKFTPPGGEVRVSVERQVKAVRFAVSDTGPGIAGAAHVRIFHFTLPAAEPSAAPQAAAGGSPA